MRLDQELTAAIQDRETVLTIGVFDGVHRGHKRLMEHLVNRAREAGKLAGVLTFKNHPDSTFRRDFKPQYITSFQDRLRLIKECGVDFVVPVTFDEELSRLRASEFVDMLKSRLHMKGLVVGPDFAMGYKREGTVKTLSQCGQEKDFFIEVVDLLEEGGVAVRSTSIRRALASGDLKTANSMLGRRFELAGPVVEGAKRGRTLGYPTANIDIDSGMICPANGIYATFAEFAGEEHEAATNIGTRPTFDDGERTVEAFVLDFDGDLYGETVRLHFVKKLRDELKFDSVDELLVRMGEDVKETRAILHSAKQA